MAAAPVIGILLAAGFSRRFGSNKLLQRLPDGQLVAQAAARALQSALPGALAVIRPGVPELAQTLREAGLQVSVCEEAIEGMGASLAHALRTLADRPATGYVVALADMPFVKPDTFRTVAACLLTCSRRLARVW